MKKKVVTILKKVLAISFAIILGVCSVACQGPCAHRDADDSGKCDMCGVDFTDAKDKCDVCGGALANGECEACDKPNPEEAKCGTCGGVLTNGKCEACDKPNVEEAKCGTCGGVLTDGKCAVCDKEEEAVKYDLNGKKVIFIGNSYTYYGLTVIEKKTSVLTQSERSNDKGYFYQLCKANGDNVQVTNWVFGGHNINYIFSDSCPECSGINHKTYLTDKYFDFVVLQPGKDDIFESSSAKVDNVINFFKSANPNVKFILSVPYHCFGTIGSTPLMTATNYLNGLKTYEKNGFIISDWGGLVMDILNKKVQVPNATQQYTKNTFVVAKSAKDGYHPNLLSGYITTLMTYCAITGENAQGQTYAFCNDSTLSSKFDFTKCIEAYYKSPYGTTNFDQVFASQSDMQGIQTLIDAHLANKAYSNYKY